MPHYYDASYYDSIPEPELPETPDPVNDFKQGDTVLVYLKRQTPEGLKTVVHKGEYLYPVEGEVLMHRVHTWTGAGFVDVITENLVLQPPSEGSP